MSLKKLGLREGEQYRKIFETTYETKIKGR